MHATNIKVLEGRNVNGLYYQGVNYLLEHGVEENSRNGRVLVAPGPVVSVYYRPTERVLFDPNRDANPFFHLMEAVWMLAGEKSSKWPVQFNQQMAEYANPMGDYDGAYGYRWRRMFEFDQIVQTVELLKKDPETRRAVIAMWSPNDLGVKSLDIPCNTHIYFDCRDRRLNMTVCCRSNDAIWGAYGANAVHMSFLQEVIAAGVDRPVGMYRQFSNNFHLYPDVPKIQQCLEKINYKDLYHSREVQPFKLVRNYDTFLDECEIFLNDPTGSYYYTNPFFYFVARPMYMSWRSHKEGDREEALHWAEQIDDEAWALVCTEWLERRYNAV